MFCIACGKPARDDARFCGKCGAKLFEPAPNEDVGASPQARPTPVPPAVERPSGTDPRVRTESTAERVEATATPDPTPPPAPRPVPFSAVTVANPPLPPGPSQEATDPPPPMPTGAPTPIATAMRTKTAAVPMSPKVLLAGGGAGVLLGVGLLVEGFWRTPWQVVPGFLCCVVGVSVMLRRFSRVMAVLGGLLLAVLIAFVASLPFGGIGQVFAVSWWRFGYVRSVPPGTAFDTAALPALPEGYQYLKEAGEEIDMVPYVVPEGTDGRMRKYTMGAKETKEDPPRRMELTVVADAKQPTVWRVSGAVKSGGESLWELAGTIGLSGDWLLTSKMTGGLLQGSLPRSLSPGRWVHLDKRESRAVAEESGFDVTDERVAIVARGEAGTDGREHETVVVMWWTSLKDRTSGKTGATYVVEEFSKDVGLAGFWMRASDQTSWKQMFYLPDAPRTVAAEVAQPEASPVPSAENEEGPVEDTASPLSQDAAVPSPDTVAPVLPSPRPVSFSAKPEVKESEAPTKKSPDERTALKWVLIPAGAFTMGCTPGDAACQADESPAHPATLTRSFQMAATETTNAQYRECVKAGACSPPLDRTAFDDSSKGNHPVVNLSWGDAVKFCQWVGGRLPTEAEWEYAARGGYEGYQYPRGKVLSARDANYGGRAQAGDVWTDSSPVGSFSANGFGLFDMAGNVWEWCADRFDEHYYGISPTQNPAGPASGARRVARGGSWALRSEFLRVSYRAGKDPTSGTSDVGFRCVREADTKGAADVPLSSEAVVPSRSPTNTSAKPDVNATAALARRSIDEESGVKWVHIRAGSFTMGCTPGDSECTAGEKPAHRVTLTKSFRAAATETTNAQYRACVEAGACATPTKGMALGDPLKQSHPVENVSWDDSATFCRWAGGRLPTEAEWEYAARGGRRSHRYPLGNALTHDDANFGRDGCCGGATEGRDQWMETAPVGSFPSNGFGMYDMAGNVWEWCADLYDSGYYGVSPPENPAGPAHGMGHAMRGGSWYYGSTNQTVSYRLWNNPANPIVGYGFRCVREADAP